MIKISSFHPFKSFLRVSQEFSDQKATVHMKSPTFETKYEVEYKDVGEISDLLAINNNLNTCGFGLLTITGVTLFLAVTTCSWLLTNPVFLRIAQMLYVSGLILYAISFRKSRYIRISDGNDEILTTMRITRQNHTLVTQAIDTIKNKSKNVRDLTTAQPFPKENPVFEHVYFDLPNLAKTTDRFYKSQIIGSQKGLFSDGIYSINYDHLSREVYRAKSGGRHWIVFDLFIAVIAIIVGFFYGFGVDFGIPFSTSVRYVEFALVAWLLSSLVARFIKSEMVGLYGKNGSVAYWIYVNKASKEKVEKIIEFVQAKISPAATDELEQA